MVEGKQRKERNKTKKVSKSSSLNGLVYLFPKTHTPTHTQKKNKHFSLFRFVRATKSCVCVCYILTPPTYLYILSRFFFFFFFFDERKRSILFTNPRREKDFAIFSVDHLTAKKPPKRGSFGIFVTNGRNINSFPFVRTHTEKAREFCEFVFFP